MFPPFPPHKSITERKRFLSVYLKWDFCIFTNKLARNCLPVVKIKNVLIPNVIDRNVVSRIGIRSTVAHFMSRTLDYGTRQGFSDPPHHYSSSSQVNFLIAPLLLAPWAPLSFPHTLTLLLLSSCICASLTLRPSYSLCCPLLVSNPFTSATEQLFLYPGRAY